METVSGTDSSSSTVTLWDYLKLLTRSTSKDSIEGILQTLWRTRRKGLDATDRSAIVNMLQLENELDLDPILVCLRMLIRRCVYDNVNNTDGIQTLFPAQVLPELQKLLTLLLQKFQNQWREDVLKEDQGALLRLKATAWNMEKTDAKSPEPTAAINLKLQNDVKFNCGGESEEVQSQVAKATTLKSMYSMREAFL